MAVLIVRIFEKFTDASSPGFIPGLGSSDRSTSRSRAPFPLPRCVFCHRMSTNYLLVYTMRIA